VAAAWLMVDRALRYHECPREWVRSRQPRLLPCLGSQGLFPAITLKVAIAGAWVVFFRFLGGVGYLFGVRQVGGFFHLGEFYILYLVGHQAFQLAQPVRYIYT